VDNKAFLIFGKYIFDLYRVLNWVLQISLSMLGLNPMNPLRGFAAVFVHFFTIMKPLRGIILVKTFI